MRKILVRRLIENQYETPLQQWRRSADGWHLVLSPMMMRILPVECSKCHAATTYQKQQRRRCSSAVGAPAPIASSMRLQQLYSWRDAALLGVSNTADKMDTDQQASQGRMMAEFLCFYSAAQHDERWQEVKNGGRRWRVLESSESHLPARVHVEIKSEPKRIG